MNDLITLDQRWAEFGERWRAYQRTTVAEAWALGGDLMALEDATNDNNFVGRLNACEIHVRTAYRYMDLRRAFMDGPPDPLEVPSINAALREIKVKKDMERIAQGKEPMKPRGKGAAKGGGRPPKEPEITNFVPESEKLDAEATILDLSQTIKAKDKLIKELSAEDPAKADMAKQAETISALERARDKSQAQVADLKRENANVRKQVAAVEKKLPKEGESPAELKGYLAAARSETTEALKLAKKNADERDKLRKEVVKLQGQIGTLQGDGKTMAARCKELSGQIDRGAKDVLALREKMRKTEDKLCEAEAIIAEIKAKDIDCGLYTKAYKPMLITKVPEGAKKKAPAKPAKKVSANKAPKKSPAKPKPAAKNKAAAKRK